MSNRLRITLTHRRLRAHDVAAAFAMGVPLVPRAFEDDAEGAVRPATMPVPERRRSSGGGISAVHLSSGSSSERAYCHPSLGSTLGCVKSNVHSEL